MPNAVDCRRISHPNVVIEDLDEGVGHLEAIYGASFMLDLPGPDWHACVIEVGGLAMELFAPRNFLLNMRNGPHYLGMEYEADVEQARAAAADHGIRIVREIPGAFHTHPADCLGADIEFYSGTFYGPEAPHVTTRTKPAEYWAAHPIGFTEPIGYTHAVIDLDAASSFLQSFLGARPGRATDREALGARGIELRIANGICELLAPVTEGALRREMMIGGQGIRSIVFGVRSVAAAGSYLQSRGLRVIPGTAPGDIAVDPRDNLGILFEFRESRHGG